MSTIVQTIHEIMLRCDVTYGALAAASAISPSTARVVMLTGELPQQPGPRRRLEKFAAINAAAKTRGDLRFVP
jgi:hypothetical protein